MDSTLLIPFKKMHGLGNDFVIIDCLKNNYSLSEDDVRLMSNRRRGIGCDQLILLRPSQKADVFMVIYNPDGSQAGMCGNVARCVAKVFFENSDKTNMSIETISGIKYAEKKAGDMYAIDMGEPNLKWSEIPLASETDTLEIPISHGGFSSPCAVNMGNPHAVFFVNDVSAVPLEVVGPPLENHPMFPQRCNIEFAQVLAPDRIRMRVWERGTGITEACGTGACATLVAAARKKLSNRKATIILDGGQLEIEWRDDNHIIMTGPATHSFEGVFYK